MLLWPGSITSYAEDVSSIDSMYSTFGQNVLCITGNASRDRETYFSSFFQVRTVVWVPATQLCRQGVSKV